MTRGSTEAGPMSVALRDAACELRLEAPLRPAAGAHPCQTCSKMGLPATAETGRSHSHAQSTDNALDAEVCIAHAC
jgi:hypothetical protein